MRPLVNSNEPAFTNGQLPGPVAGELGPVGVLEEPAPCFFRRLRRRLCLPLALTSARLALPISARESAPTCPRPRPATTRRRVAPVACTLLRRSDSCVSTCDSFRRL